MKRNKNIRDAGKISVSIYCKIYWQIKLELFFVFFFSLTLNFFFFNGCACFPLNICDKFCLWPPLHVISHSDAFSTRLLSLSRPASAKIAMRPGSLRRAMHPVPLPRVPRRAPPAIIVQWKSSRSPISLEASGGDKQRQAAPSGAAGALHAHTATVP